MINDIRPKLVVVLLLLAFQSYGQVNLCKEASDGIVISEYQTAIAEDNSTIAPSETKFTTAHNPIYDLGVEEVWHWIKFDVQNPCHREDFVLKLENPVIDDIVFQVYSSGRKVHERSLGESFGQSQDLPIAFVFPIQKDFGDSFQIFVRLNSPEHVKVPFIFSNLEQESIVSKRYHLYLGLYIGILLILIAYNLFLGLSVGERVYLYYTFFIFTVGLTQITFLGFSQAYLWHGSSFWLNNGLFLIGALSGFATALFVQKFLRTKTENRIFHYGLFFIMAVEVLAIALTLAGYKRQAYNIIDVNALLGSIIILVGSTRMALKGSRSARFFLLGWSFFLLSIIIFILKDFQVLPYNTFTKYSLIIGSMMEAVMLSLALADSINVLKKENEKKEKERMAALEQNRQIVLRQNQLLEKKVTERTSELQASNQELDSALQTLQGAQSQLIESEKMASLGQLTASIAHELNNPINFVSSNVGPLKQDINEMFEIMGSAKLETEGDESELKVLKEEAEALLNGIEDGAKRTSDIVRGLRIFSRMDENAFQAADINECLRSTVIILKSSLKDVCTIKANYGEIPLIRCNSGKMTQVFTNILTNASQAIASAGRSQEEGVIEIETSFDGSQVITTIRDNGTGLTDEVKNKIFEPFFTTKAVGLGTGLGLSIVKGIVDDHKGTIQVNSVLGEGAEFVICLPNIQ